MQSLKLFLFLMNGTIEKNKINAPKLISKSFYQAAKQPKNQLESYYLYYNEPKLATFKTSLLSIDQDSQGSYIIPRETIFHAQGGGQPKDDGYILIGEKKYKVVGLVDEKEQVKHYLDEEPKISYPEETLLDMHIDLEKRISYSQYHTAGHLIANIVEEHYKNLIASKGNHFPDAAAVTFKPQNQEPLETLSAFIKQNTNLIEDLNERAKNIISNDLEISYAYENNRRKVQIGSMKAYPCGGTHVRSLLEIKNLSIDKISLKKREGLRISYSLKS